MTARVAAVVRVTRPFRSTYAGAWKPRTALFVTHIRLRGTILSTSVQAESQGPSMITFLPDFRTCVKKSTYDAATPPELDSIRTSVELDRISAKAGVTRVSDKAAYEMKRLIGALLAFAFLPRLLRDALFLRRPEPRRVRLLLGEVGTVPHNTKT